MPARTSSSPLTTNNGLPSEVAGLVAGYRDVVQPRMLGLPVVNPALEVEAVGFRPHGEYSCGVLIAPWFLNLVAVPKQHDMWTDSAPGKTFNVVFPTGELEFVLSKPDGLYPHLSLPLFTTVLDFADQETARNVALEVLRLIFDERSGVILDDTFDSTVSESLNRPMSRRDLLRGLISPGEGD